MKLKCIETWQRLVEGYKLLEKHDIFKMHTFMHMVEYSLMTSMSKVEVGDRLRQNFIATDPLWW